MTTRLLSTAPPPWVDLIPQTDLPIETAIDDLRRALLTEGAAVLVAPPGAGKTTLVPLRLLDETWLNDGRIVMLEPRRLAARAAAHRIAHLLGQKPGHLIGYQTRDERIIGPSTRLEIVTEGVLTRRLQSDPSFEGVGLVIFDEVHERNLPTDLGLALSLDVRKNLRPDVKILAMSATADADTFARLLAGGPTPVPIVRSDGRLFDVDIIWVPATKTQRPDDAVVVAVRRALREQEGDILVFLAGMGDITRVQRVLVDELHGQDIDVWPLSGSLSLEEQDRALAASPRGRRRIVLSTDIAETSLTVEGIRVVVDSGLTRIPRFDTSTGMSRLVTVPTSRASCEQRAGRAGRVEPGVAYRTWSKLEHAARRSHLDPEIEQVDLASFALEVAAWGTPIDDLDFIRRPPTAALAQAVELLQRLGALTDEGAPTDLGRRMLSIPVHPRLARMVAACPAEDHSLACLLATLVEERDLLSGPPDRRPVDLRERIDLVIGLGHNPNVDRRAVERLRARTHDLARRLRVPMEWESIDPERAAELLLLAYPDRVGIRRQPGQFQLAGGTAAWIPRTDPVAQSAFIVAADVDGNKTSTRVRLALATDEDTVVRMLGDSMNHSTTIVWDKEAGDVVENVTARLGTMLVSQRRRRPPAGPETSEVLFTHLRNRSFAPVLDRESVTKLRTRVEFLRVTFSTTSTPVDETADAWPDWSERHLAGSAHEWLEPYLAGMTSIDEVLRLDVAMLLRSQLPWSLGARLDELAPSAWELPNGRSVPIDYESSSAGAPAAVIKVRVQDLFGTKIHPSIASGRVPLVVHLLSPADRPIQITADLPGFWSGSWADVRKDLAGRYPKHQWPVDPANAEPRRSK